MTGDVVMSLLAVVFSLVAVVFCILTIRANRY